MGKEYLKRHIQVGRDNLGTEGSDFGIPPGAGEEAELQMVGRAKAAAAAKSKELAKKKK